MLTAWLPVALLSAAASQTALLGSVLGPLWLCLQALASGWEAGFASSLGSAASVLERAERTGPWSGQ